MSFWKGQVSRSSKGRDPWDEMSLTPAKIQWSRNFNQGVNCFSTCDKALDEMPSWYVSNICFLCMLACAWLICNFDFSYSVKGSGVKKMFLLNKNITIVHLFDDILWNMAQWNSNTRLTGKQKRLHSLYSLFSLHSLCSFNLFCRL